MIPESQRWTLRKADRTAIAKGMSWAAATPPKETDLEELSAEALRHRRFRRSGRAVK
ncbi:MAG TPA: hypothetical protein VMW75_07185 [Thermoanaerobaculia bacterium]|nr:hypothetical protein [Thermoanaerobaculia bacterium]